jgi:hypothetical protein
MSKKRPPATPAEKATLGPQPAARDYLPGLAAAPAGYRPGVIGSGPLADGVRHHSDAAQLAQSHRVGTSPVPGVDAHDSPAHLGEQPAMQPQPGATLTLQVPQAHRANGLYTDAYGRAPTVTVQVQDAARASSTFPGDVRAAPAGAGGLASPDYRAEPSGPMPETPQGAPGAVIHYDRDVPYQLQRPGGDVGAPGAAWSTRAPGDDPGPGGGFVTRR